MSSSVIPATTPVSWTAVPNGTAALPSFSFQNSQGTGIYRVSADVLGLSTAGVQRVVVDASGNVGVGTASPGRKLDIVGADNTPSARLTLSANTNGAWQGIEFVHGAYIKTGIRSYSTGVTDAGALTFLTAPAGDVPNERMRIDSSGNLLVGKTAQSSSTVGVEARPGGGFSVTSSASTNGSSTLEVYSTGAGAFRFYVGLGGTVFATSTTITGISDERLKENVRDLDDGLNVVLALKPRKFDWKKGKGADIKNARGFIAQEFEQVLPDMVEEWKDPAPEGEEPYKAVNANLIPTLVKAIQEQQAMIEDLKAEIEALKAK